MKDKLVFIAELPIYVICLVLGVLLMPLVWVLQRQNRKIEEETK